MFVWFTRSLPKLDRAFLSRGCAKRESIYSAFLGICESGQGGLSFERVIVWDDDDNYILLPVVRLLLRDIIDDHIRATWYLHTRREDNRLTRDNRHCLTLLDSGYGGHDTRARTMSHPRNHHFIVTSIMNSSRYSPPSSSSSQKDVIDCRFQATDIHSTSTIIINSC